MAEIKRDVKELIAEFELAILECKKHKERKNLHLYSYWSGYAVGLSKACGILYPEIKFDKEIP